MVFDTGSVSVFVDSILCDTPVCVDGHNQYNPANSPTFKATNPIEGEVVQYGSGALEGVLGFDTFYIGNITIPNVEFFQIMQ